MEIHYPVFINHSYLLSKLLVNSIGNFHIKILLIKITSI